MASLASNGGHVVGKSAVVDRVDTGCNAGLGGSALGQLCHQLGVRSFAAHRGAVFTVQGDVKDTGAELLRHFSLQLQAFEHPRRCATVVVANRQSSAASLRPEQNIARMLHMPWLTAGA